jgi:putative ABC transport system ATP-binding protein
VTSPEPAVALRGVSGTYGRGAAAVHALHGVDLDLAAGTFTAVMGGAAVLGGTVLLGVAGTAPALRRVLRGRPGELAGVRE